ncbi:MAG: hypothetical protein V3W43_04275 [Desulfatiglandaceae bacterium]
MPPKDFKCKQWGNRCLNLNDAFETCATDQDIRPFLPGVHGQMVLHNGTFGKSRIQCSQLLPARRPMTNDE